nr:hypothetical protein [Ectobacillus panaciterrae]
MILYLLQITVGQSGWHITIPCPKAIHLHPTHWAAPFPFLEDGVFSPTNDKYTMDVYGNAEIVGK